MLSVSGLLGTYVKNLDSTREGAESTVTGRNG